MTIDEKIRQIIETAWTGYSNKVAAGLLQPENEKMMQLQFAMMLQSLVSLYEFRKNESIKVLLEVPVTISRLPSKRIIDIVIVHAENQSKKSYPIELKCFRVFTRDGNGKKRGAQNLGMYDYWADIENVEQYSTLEGYGFGTQLTLTDDDYYVSGRHQGQQVSVYSTAKSRARVSGILSQAVVNRLGRIELFGAYLMGHWKEIGEFHFVKQHTA
jgi:hypothetical protein